MDRSHFLGTMNLACHNQDSKHHVTYYVWLEIKCATPQEAEIWMPIFSPQHVKLDQPDQDGRGTLCPQTTFKTARNCALAAAD